MTADFSLIFSDAAIFARLLGAEWECLCEFVRGFICFLFFNGLIFFALILVYQLTGSTVIVFHLVPKSASELDHNLHMYYFFDSENNF